MKYVLQNWKRKQKLNLNKAQYLQLGNCFIKIDTEARNENAFFQPEMIIKINAGEINTHTCRKGCLVDYRKH